MPPLACVNSVEAPHTHIHTHPHSNSSHYAFARMPGEGSLPAGDPTLYNPNPGLPWSAAHSSALYGVDGWGAPYFKVNEGGNVAVRPHGARTLLWEEIDVMKVVKKAVGPKSAGGLGMTTPLIIRFPDILRHRLEALQCAFDTAIAMQRYDSHFQGVYPVKCNQDRYVVENIVEFGKEFAFGLEAGSKPELLLTMACLCKGNPKALLICNGYKDEEYVSLALVARSLNFNTVIVLEQVEELDVVISASRKLSVTPVIGIRAKLRTKHAGHFGSTSGEKGKFGLTTMEILNVVKKLKAADMLDCLQLLHFHIGSQIPSVALLNDGVSEASFIYCELAKLGANMRIIDIGGGLGIDYDGTKSGSSDMSVAYTLEEYASTVVTAVRTACDQRGVYHPVLCSESGRALVSHHSLLIFDVVSVDQKTTSGLDFDLDGLPDELAGEYKSLEALARFGDYPRSLVCADQMKMKAVDLFKEGRLGLQQLAMVDGLCDTLYPSKPAVCHVNLSIFTSIPDYWAIGQLFPVMPIHKLTEKPTVQAILSDLTCDSDGKIDTFIGGAGSGGPGGLPVHSLSSGEEPYYLGMFLGGAYQEALGGLHNLFGTPNVVHVVQSSGPHCFAITRALPGQTMADVLALMMHEPHMMFDSLKCRIEDSLTSLSLPDDHCTSALTSIANAFHGLPYLSSSVSAPEADEFYDDHWSH